MSPTQMVARFIEGWEKRDIPAIAACLAEDAVWHNIPYPPIVGRANIVPAIERFLADMVEVEFRLHHQAEAGPATVMTERNDIFRRADGTVIDIPVMGIFEIEHGLIRAWRDYFDRGAMEPRA